MANTYVTFTQTTGVIMDGADSLFVQGRINGTNLPNAIDINGDNNLVFIEGTVSNVGGRAMRLSGSGSSVTVTETGAMLQTSLLGGSGISMEGGIGNHRVANFGQIIGNFGVATSTTSNNNQIFNYGLIHAREDLPETAAVTFISLDNRLVNEGTIIGARNGVLTRAAETGNEVINHGSITGSIGVRVQTLAVTDVTNYGTITGSDGLALLDTGLGSTLQNFGTMVGSVIAEAAGSVMVIHNSGLIDGDIRLGDGDDIYLGRQNGYVTGVVDAGNGNDTVYGGADGDVLLGQVGDDIMRGRGGDDDINGGDGADTIHGHQGDDTIVGSSGGDLLFGGTDDDRIFGGSSADTINGGRGDDVMSGGSSKDVFVFGQASGDDTIVGFTNNADKIDLSFHDVGSRAALVAAGALRSDKHGGSVIDLHKIGGDGTIHVDTMTVADWTASDFLF